MQSSLVTRTPLSSNFVIKEKFALNFTFYNNTLLVTITINY